MKKLLTLILTLVLVCTTFSLVSCNLSGSDAVEKLVGKTPEELYAASQEKLKDAKSYSVNASQVITMSQDGESMTMTQTVITKVNGDNSYLKSTNDQTSYANMEVWYVDGIVYASMAGMKAKAEIDIEEYRQKYMNSDPSESTLLDLPKSWFEDIKFEKEGEQWVLNFVVSGDKYTELLGNAGLGSEVNGDVQYKIYFSADGDLEKVDTAFDMTIAGVKAHCVSTAVVTFGEVTITPPADADSYTTTEIS